MTSSKKAKESTVKIKLDFDSDYENFLYEAGKEYEVSQETAKRLQEINKMLKKENA